MLKRESRINSFELKTLKKGVSMSTPLFNAKVYKNLENKILLITSKKHLKKANKRNLLRRRVYFAFNKIRTGEGIKNSIFVLYYMLKDTEQKVPKYSIIEKQIKIICGIQ